MLSPAPLLSLVVLSFRRFDATTGPCLATLGAASGDPRCELILVDNGSADGSAERCAEFASRRPGARCLPQPENLGFAGGMNAGAAAARGEWLCLVNSDTLFPAGALESLYTTLRGVPAGAAMVGPVTNAAGNGQRLPLPDLPMQAVAGVGAAAMGSPTGLLTPTYRTDFFCVAIRRDAWQQLGGLDTRFGLGYYEDFDFSLRLRKAGYEQLIAEDVFVAHVGSASFESLGAAQHDLIRRNRSLLLERHRDANFEHVRDGNALALRHLIAAGESMGWSSGLRRRAAWRLAALLWDEPRSPFKRWRYRHRTRDIRQTLAANGVEARFPVASDAS